MFALQYVSGTLIKKIQLPRFELDSLQTADRLVKKYTAINP